MAYRSNLIDEEDQKGIAPATPSSGVFTAQGSTGTPAQNQQATPTSAPSAAGTGFVNLERYLGANQGAGAGIGKAALGTTGKEAYEASLGSTTAGYGSETQKAGEATAKKAGELGAGLEAKPMDTIQGATEFLGESYSGPKADVAAARAKAEEAAQQQKLATLGTTAGQQSALQTAFRGQGKPYTKGYSILDQFIMGANPEAQGQFEAQRQEQVERAREAGTGAQEQLKSQQKAAEEQFKKQQESVKAAGTKAFTKRASDVDKALAQKMIEAEARKTGFEGVVLPSEGDVASEQQLAELEALSKIAGLPFDRNAYAKKTYAEGTAKPEKMIREETRGVMVPESQVVGYDSKGRPITEWERDNVLT